MFPYMLYSVGSYPDVMLELRIDTLPEEGAVTVTGTRPLAPSPMYTVAVSLLEVSVTGVGFEGGGVGAGAGVGDGDGGDTLGNTAVTVYLAASSSYVPAYIVSVCPAGIVYLKCLPPASSSAIIYPHRSYSVGS